MEIVDYLLLGLGVRTPSLRPGCCFLGWSICPWPEEKSTSWRSCCPAPDADGVMEKGLRSSSWSTRSKYSRLRRQAAAGTGCPRNSWSVVTARHPTATLAAAAAASSLGGASSFPPLLHAVAAAPPQLRTSACRSQSLEQSMAIDRACLCQGGEQRGSYIWRCMVDFSMSCVNMSSYHR